MFLPSLANISTDLETDYATVSIAVSGYLAVTAVIQLVAGPLSDRVGRRPVVLCALVLFSVASLACALAPDIEMFLAFRMLQGGIISGYTLSLAIVRDTTPERKAASTIGYISSAMALAPMLGPMFGGVLDTAFGWRANFYFYALAGVSLCLVCWFDLGETNQRDTEQAKSRGESVFALIREPLFWAYSLCATFSIGAFYIFLAGASLVAKSNFGINTAQLGLMIGSITVGFMTGGFLAGRLASAFASTTMMLAGRIVACSGLVIGIVILMFGQISTYTFFGCTVFVGLGNGITLPSTSAGAMSIRPKLAGSAAGFSGALIVAVGAVLTMLTGLMLSENSAPLVLLVLMLAASGMGLLAALWAIGLERSKPMPRLHT